MKLSLYEQETIILYNQAEATAEVYSHDPRLLEKLRRLAEKYPDQIVKRTVRPLRCPNAACRCGSRTAPSAARLPASGPKPPGIGRPSPKRAVSEHGRERI